MLPFKIVEPYSIYAIEVMLEYQIDQMGDLIRKAIARCSLDGRKWYALDWQHSAFLFNPHNIQEQQSVWIDDERHPKGGYSVQHYKNKYMKYIKS